MSKLSHQAKRKSASIPTIRRLPLYFRVVKAAIAEGHKTISATDIAREIEMESILVRKDLAVTGIVGKPRVGYLCNDLISAILSFLGWDIPKPAVIVGVGNLGSALMGYQHLINNGLSIVAGFDINKKNGQNMQTPIYPITKISEIIKKEKVELAILTVPPSEAQAIANTLIDSGVRQIWNFTNIKLRVPENVLVLREDLSSGYAVLTSLSTGLETNEESLTGYS